MVKIMSPFSDSATEEKKWRKNLHEHLFNFLLLYSKILTFLTCLALHWIYTITVNDTTNKYDIVGSSSRHRRGWNGAKGNAKRREKVERK